jgi:hypothetical protein
MSATTTTTATANVDDNTSKERPDVAQEPHGRKISIDHHDEKVNFEPAPTGIITGGPSGSRLSAWFARLGLWRSRPRSAPAPTPGEKNESGDAVVDTKAEETIPAVPFLALLFRYFPFLYLSIARFKVIHSSFSTKLELLLNAIGLLSAVAAGASQVTFWFFNVQCNEFMTLLSLATDDDPLW